MADEEDATEWEIQGILGDKDISGQTFYLVKWKGFDDEQSTWEPEESFTFGTTIEEWKIAKARNEVLGPEEIAEVQARMDAFQARTRSHEAGSITDSDVEMASDDEDDEVKIDNSRPSVVGTAASRMNPSETTNISSSTPTQTAPRSPIQIAQTITQRIIKAGKISYPTKPATPQHPPDGRGSSTTNMATSPARTSAKPKKGIARRVQNPTSDRVGQPFRNLSHQNNHKKRAREEPIVPASQLNLMSPEDIPDVGAGDTAHILPAGPKRSPYRGGSWMFFSQSPDDNLQKSPHTINQPTSTGNLPLTNIVLEDHPMEGMDASPTAGKGGQQGHVVQHTQSRQVSKPATAAASGDITNVKVTLIRGNTVGNVKLSLVPWKMLGTKLKCLRVNGNINVEFRSEDVLSRHTFDTALKNSDYSIGLIEPFPETEETIKALASNLEMADKAGFWISPGNESLCLLLYSTVAPSWQDFPPPSMHTGWPRNKLHFVVLPRAPEYLLQPTKDRRKQPAETSNAVQRNEPLGNMKEEPELTTAVRSAILRKTTTSSRPNVQHHKSQNQSLPLTQATSASLGLRQSSSTSHEYSHPPSMANQYDHYLQSFESDPMIPEFTTLKFQDFTQAQTNDPKVDVKRPHFYISFARSHPYEAALLSRWLQSYVDLRHIHTDANDQSWRTLCRRSSTTAISILFHANNPCYYDMTGLGALLNTDHVKCYSLMFNSDHPNGKMFIEQTQLFPRGTTFLITEDNIVRNPEQALFFAQFFTNNLKVGWKMVHRPAIRSWLRELADAERYPDRRSAMYELLILIEKLCPLHNAYGEYVGPGEDMSYDSRSENEPFSYIISPSNLPGYRDQSSDEDAVKRRDKILIEYFCGLTAFQLVKRSRRFWIFSKDRDVPNSGHIYFQDPDKFVKQQTKNAG